MNVLVVAMSVILGSAQHVLIQLEITPAFVQVVILLTGTNVLVS